ncbi:MAG TPA: SRPBCC family protein [Natronosporangium sp.]|nr:SRPBCC family protein [Natronosporangium sp.]
MAEQTSTREKIADKLPTDRLKSELGELMKVAGKRVTQQMTGRLGGLGQKATSALLDKGKEMIGGAAGGAGGVAKKVAGAGVETAKQTAQQATEKVKEAAGGGGATSGGHAKVTNIVEDIDIGVPVSVAYNQWTQFTDFPGFMKQVEKVEQESDTELKWRGKILWSHRDWKSTIIDQVPDQRIVWQSEGAKGYVNGTVTFHEIGPNLTKILVVLEYYPQGFFEKTANLWRAQGRRVRLELKHFRRHVMTQVALHPEEVQGWRGEIHDSEVTSEPPRDGESAEQPSSAEKAEGGTRDGSDEH